MRKWLVGALCAGQMWAQCSMCQTAAAAQSTAGTKAMNTAILILLFPALIMFCGAFAMLRSGTRDDHHE